MPVLFLIAISILLVGCGGSGGPRTKPLAPGSSRLKIERPGRGAALDEELAKLILANKSAKAMQLCNDILFSSRSNRDRETANYWRTVLMAKEEIDVGNYDNAIGVFKKGSKWWKHKSKDYHVAVIVEMLEELKRKEKQAINLNKTIKKLNAKVKTDKVKKLEAENRRMLDEIVELKVENKKMEKLLIDLQ